MKFPSIFTVFFIFTPCVALESCFSDISIDNIVWLGSPDAKIGSQDAVKKVIELIEE